MTTHYTEVGSAYNHSMPRSSPYVCMLMVKSNT